MAVNSNQTVFLKIKDAPQTKTLDWPFPAIPEMGDRVRVNGVDYRVINRAFHTADMINADGAEPSVRVLVWMEPFK